MGLRFWRKTVFLLVPGLMLTATIWAGDSARRGFEGPPLPPPDVSEPASPEVIVIDPGHPTVIPDYYGYGAAAPACDAPQYAPSCEAPSGACYDLPMNCCECCPLLTVRGGAVFLRRENGSNLGIVAGTPSLGTNDLDFDYEIGPMVSVIRHGVLGSCWDLELTYFGVDNDATATTADADAIASTPAIFVIGVAPATLDYDSRLHSTEVNLRRQWNDWLTVLGGFRWVELGDDLNGNIDGGLATFGYDVNNHLYGFQIGLDARLWERGAFSLEAYGKAGIYGNSSDVDATTVGVGGALPLVSVSDSQTAFIGDAALTGVYNLTDRWSLRGGYQVLWVDGVALAPAQLNDVNIATGIGAVDMGNTAFYHGFTVAAQYWW